MRTLRYLLLVLAPVIFLLAGCSYLGIGSAPVSTKTPGTISAQPGAFVLPTIADVVELVESSVVAIDTEAVSFDMANRAQVQKGAGSGWILDESGRVVTNYHVVEGATSVTVTFKDRRAFIAEVSGSDAFTDIAILQVKNAGKLPAARVGDSSKMRVGDWVVSIGNPLGFGISAKEGIVSRLGVSMEISPGQILHDLIETSAAINAGNSGGPLVNMAGEVIGITSYKIGTQGVEGMGYAININDVGPVVQELVASGCVTRPWLGPTLTTVDQTVAMRYRLSINKGAMVTDVPVGSPAEKAGLAKGDIIISFGGTEINNVPQLTETIHSSQVGQAYQIVFWRGNLKSTTEVMLITSPDCK